MKRSVLPAIALVLVVTACGVGAKAAPQATVAAGRVPAATRTIVVRAPTWSRTVTSPAKVGQIVRWFDGLARMRHTAVACPLVLRPVIRVSFRSARGAELAQAGVPTPVAGICDPIGFRSGGTAPVRLVEHGPGQSLARRLQLLLR